MPRMLDQSVAPLSPDPLSPPVGGLSPTLPGLWLGLVPEFDGVPSGLIGLSGLIGFPPVAPGPPPSSGGAKSPPGSLSYSAIYGAPGFAAGVNGVGAAPCPAPTP